MALKEKPDVIVTDYVMPQGSGKYFLGLLKGAQSTRNIPVIVLTGAKLDSSGQDRELARVLLEDFGAAAYLEKPLDMEELKAELGRHIDLPDPPGSPPQEPSGVGRLQLLPVK